MSGESKIERRRTEILQILKKEGLVKVTSLTELLGTSAVTIRSDLAALEDQGYLQRTLGGAILTERNTYHTDLERRIDRNLPLKEMIAKRTAKLVPNGSTLMMNSGTTTLLIAKELKYKSTLTIVTNSIEIAMEVGHYPTFRVILLGGMINAQFGFLHGKDTVEQLMHYKADYAILAVDGICKKTGLTTLHFEEALVDRTMMERSRTTIIAADSSKFEHEGFYFVADYSGISQWVTDDYINQHAIATMQEQGIEIIIAKKDED